MYPLRVQPFCSMKSTQRMPISRVNQIQCRPSLYLCLLSALDPHSAVKGAADRTANTVQIM